jgi:uncharacterized protein
MRIAFAGGAHLFVVMTRTFLICLALVVAGCAEKHPRDVTDVALDCYSGLYRAESGHVLAMTPAEGGMRWRTPEGQVGLLKPAETGGGWISTRGWTDERDGNTAQLGACPGQQIHFGPAGAQETYARVPLEIRETTFVSHGQRLAGRLIWPAGAARATLAVQTHGSEDTSARRRATMAYLLAGEGIASFVYDKRGTGGSEGTYTQDFRLLADDADAALVEARRMAGDRIDRVGFMGGSQGGWIAPLAASHAQNVDFVVALYGFAENALAEDRDEVIQGLARKGWGPAEQAKGAELSDAAGAIMRSHFQSGYRDFDRLRSAYRNEPWYKDVEGEFTGEMLGYPELALRIVGPTRDEGTSWDYEPMPVLRALPMPQLWMLARDDTEAPSAETARRLRSLQAEGRPIDLAVYPGADHGMIVFTQVGDERRETGHVQNYFRTIAAWIKSRDLSLARAAGAEVTQVGGPAVAAVPPSN